MAHLAGPLEDDFIQAEIELVQQARIDKVPPPRFIVEDTSLGQEVLQRRAGKWVVRDGGWVMWIKVRSMQPHCADHVVISSPHIILCVEL